MNIPNEDQAKGVRKYLYEYALIALAGCVVYLFYMYHSINSFIQTSLMQSNIEMRITIEKNTDALNRFTFKTEKQ